MGSGGVPSMRFSTSSIPGCGSSLIGFSTLMKYPKAPDPELEAATGIAGLSEERKQFMLARSHCIEYYAAYEERLAQLCSHFMGVPIDVSGIFFFRMNNARSRHAAIEKLLRKKYGDQYNLFWNSLLKGHMGPMDDIRNKIVHWKLGVNYGMAGRPPHGLVDTQWYSLFAPNWSDRTADSEVLFLHDLYEFILKTNFICQLLYFFHQHLLGEERPMTPDTSPLVLHPAWPQIFAEPITYPPPDTHPLFPNDEARQSQPPASRE